MRYQILVNRTFYSLNEKTQERHNSVPECAVAIEENPQATVACFEKYRSDAPSSAHDRRMLDSAAMLDIMVQPLVAQVFRFQRGSHSS